MRGNYFWIVLVVVLSSSVFGVISSDISINENYFMGESIILSGSVNPIESGVFRISAVCDGSQKTVYSKIVKQDDNLDFEQEILLSTDYNDKRCYFSLVLVDQDGDIIDQKQTSSFSVSSDFNVDLKASKEIVVLGDLIRISGNVIKQDNPFQGQVTLFINHGGEDVLIENILTKNGEVEYWFEAVNIEGGAYDVSLEVMDTYGNKKRFENLLSLDVHSDLEVEVKANKEIFLPGEFAILEVDISDYLNNRIEKGEIRLTLKKNTTTYSFDSLPKKIKYLLPQNVRSGEHEIDISVVDNLGSYGGFVVRISVESVPSYLDIKIEQESFDPGDTIGIMPLLYDQGYDTINEPVSILVESETGKQSINSPSHQMSYIQLSDYASPGKRIITASYDNLEYSMGIFVNEVKFMNISFSSPVVRFFNKGNVDYDIDYSIYAIGSGTTELYYFPIKATISKNESYSFDISKEVVDGVYDLFVVPSVMMAGFEVAAQDALSALSGFVSGDNGYDMPVYHAGSVDIEDNRPAIKKGYDSLASITGRATGVGDGNMNYIAFVFAVLLVVAFIVIKVFAARKNTHFDPSKFMLKQGDEDRSESIPEKKEAIIKKIDPIAPAVSTAEPMKEKTIVRAGSESSLKKSQSNVMLMKKSRLDSHISHAQRDDMIGGEKKRFYIMVFKNLPSEVTRTAQWSIKNIADSFYSSISSTIDELDAYADSEGEYIILLVDANTPKNDLISAARSISESLKKITGQLGRYGKSFISGIVIFDSQVPVTYKADVLAYSKFRGLIPSQEFLRNSHASALVIESVFRDLIDREYKLRKIDLKADEKEFFEFDDSGFKKF